MKPKLALAPDTELTPMTAEGSRAITERFYALNRALQSCNGTEVGRGGCLGGGSLTSPSTLPSPKPKRLTVIS